jgi:hypothetical protein
MIWIQIRREEAALMAVMPTDYARYRTHTTCLIPGIVQEILAPFSFTVLLDPIHRDHGTLTLSSQRLARS